MISKITQKQMAFYKLYAERAKDPQRYVPTWEFVGEMFVEELNEWVLMSYKCPTRLTDLYQENTALLDRKLIKGKSGAEYFGYRFKEGVGSMDIKDSRILEFYKRIKRYHEQKNQSDTSR